MKRTCFLSVIGLPHELVFTFINPMVFMMAVNFTVLSMTIVKLSKSFVTTGLTLGTILQLIFAVLLLILGVLVAIQGVKKLTESSDKKSDKVAA